MSLTSIMLIVGAVLVGALGVTGFLLKQSYAANGALETKLANAQEIIDQREKDAKANAIAVAQLAQKLNDTQTKVITVTEKIYAAPVTRACAESPAMRAATDGVRNLLAPALQAGSSPKPLAPMPGPSAGAGQPKR